MSKSKYKELSINTIAFTIGSFGSKFIAFFLVPLYTYVLTTGEYGNVDLVATTVQLLIPTLTFNIQDAVLRYSLDKDYEREDVLRVSARIIWISSICVSAIICIVKELHIFELSPGYLWFLFFSFVTGAAHNSISMYLRSKNQMKLVALCGIISTLIICLSNILLLLVIKMGVNGYMLSQIAGTVVSMLVMIIGGEVIPDLRKGKWNRRLSKSMIAYSLPLVANSIAWWINTASDRYILTFFCGAAINGIYAIAYKIPSILALIQGTFYNAWSVSAITEFDKDDKDGFIGNVFSLYAIASIICCSVIMILNVPLASILYAKEFFEAWKYVPLLLVGTIYNGLGLFIGCIYVAVKKTREISSTTILGAVINTVLNFSLIPFWGANGAAFATVIGYFVVFIIRSIRVKNIVKMRVNWIPIVVSMFFVFAQCAVAIFIKRAWFQVPFVIAIIVINYQFIRKVIATTKNGMCFIKEKFKK